jgi:hypothetical protein
MQEKNSLFYKLVFRPGFSACRPNTAARLEAGRNSSSLMLEREGFKDKAARA